MPFFQIYKPLLSYSLVIIYQIHLSVSCLLVKFMGLI